MAVEDESFGGRLRRLRTEAGLSIAEFAERTKYSKGYISKIETGAKPPNPELARCCDEALGASGALAELAPEEAADGPAEAVATVAAGMAAGSAETSPGESAEAVPDEAVSADVVPAPVVAVSVEDPPAEAAEAASAAGETAAESARETPAAPASVTLAEAFAHEHDAHIPSQNPGPAWPSEPPPVGAEKGPFAEWAVRAPEATEATEPAEESALALSDPSREDASSPEAEAPQTGTPGATAAETDTAEPAKPASESSASAASSESPAAASKSLAVRESAPPSEPAPVLVAETPSRRRRLILAGLAVLLVAVAVAGAFLLLHLAGEDRPPVDGRVHPPLPGQQYRD